MRGAALTTRVVAHRYAVKITMTDYLGSQAWQDEVIALLRTSATPPTVAAITGKDQACIRWTGEPGNYVFLPPCRTTPAPALAFFNPAKIIAPQAH
jgi:hypothetical protein